MEENSRTEATLAPPANGPTEHHRVRVGAVGGLSAGTSDLDFLPGQANEVILIRSVTRPSAWEIGNAAIFVVGKHIGVAS